MFARIACQPFLKIEDMENLGENFPQIQIVFGSRLSSCRCFGKTRAAVHIFGEETSKEKYLLKKSVKFKDLRVALNYLEKGHFMFSFDIRSGYHHVLIFPPHQSFLGFSWFYKVKNRYFYFRVLPFGLSSAPYIFTKLLRPLVAYWRQQGIHIVVYLHDGLGEAPSYQGALDPSHSL